MAYFVAIVRSLYDINWLKGRQLDRSAAWRYFIRLVLLATIVFAVVVGVKVFTRLPAERDKLIKALPEFTATFKRGHLTVINLSQPYVYRGFGETPLVLIVDTMSTSSRPFDQELRSGETGVFVTGDALVVRDQSTAENRSEGWSQISDTSFTRSQAVDLITRFTHVRYLIILLTLIGIFALVSLIFQQLIWLLIAVTIAWFLARVVGQAWIWRNLFTIGLYATTWPILIGLVLSWFGWGITGIGFLVLLAFLLALVLTREVSQPPQAV